MEANTKNQSSKANLFGSLIKRLSKGEIDREAFWWDVFYRYEAAIGITVGFILGIIVVTIIYPLLLTQPDLAKNGDFKYFSFMLFTSILGTGASLFLSGAMVLPFYESAPNNRFVKRYDIGPARVALVNILSVGGIVVLLYAIARLFYKNIYLSNAIGSIIAIILLVVLVLVAINALSYCNWRFDWGIKNQDIIYSRYYKYRTSGVDYASERIQWKFLRWYKAMIAVVLLAGPSIFGLSCNLTLHRNKQKGKTGQSAQVRSSETKDGQQLRGGMQNRHKARPQSNNPKRHRHLRNSRHNRHHNQR